MAGQLTEILDQISPDKDSAIYCDYDGTLTPIVENPDDARITSEQRQFLEEFAGFPHIKFAIISGRSIDTLKELSGIEGINWIGNHGFEIELPDGERIITIDKTIWEEMKDELQLRFQPLVQTYEGTQIEMKSGSFAFHYRQMNSTDKEEAKKKAMIIIEEVAEKFDINTIHGKEVIEIKPEGFDKGVALHKLRRIFNSENDNEMYLGDDTTDKDAMRALPASAINVWIGKERPVEADYRLDSVNEVYELFEHIKEKYE